MRGFFNSFEVLLESPASLSLWRGLVVKHSVSGKPAHDVRIVAAMTHHRVTHLVTFNAADFKRFDKIIVHHPEDVVSVGIV